MTTYEWLLFLHVTGAFLLVGGAVVAIVLDIAAQRRERPSEIALLSGLVRIPVVGIVIGSILLLVFGLWLVDEGDGYSYDEAWIDRGDRSPGRRQRDAAGIGGRREEATRLDWQSELAEKGDAPSVGPANTLRDPITLVAELRRRAWRCIAVIAVMVWKPGP